MGFVAIQDRFFRGLELLLVALLVAMVVMVFGNVVLRWQSDLALSLGASPPLPGGIDVSEELSRFAFVWLTFIGAVVVARENAHLGVDALVQRLGPGGRLFCMVLSDALVLFCCALFFWGTLKQAPVNASNIAPVTGISTLWVFGVGLFSSLGIGAMVAARLVRALAGRLAPGELDAFAGELPPETQALKAMSE